MADIHFYQFMKSNHKYTFKNEITFLEMQTLPFFPYHLCNNKTFFIATACSHIFKIIFSGLDLTTLIIPLLALVGLFLLFPTYVTLTSVRYFVTTLTTCFTVQFIGGTYNLYDTYR